MRASPQTIINLSDNFTENRYSLHLFLDTFNQMLSKAQLDDKVKTWLTTQIKKSVVKEVTECYDLMDEGENGRNWNIFRICKKQLNAVRSKIVLTYVKVLELFVLIYK